MKFQLVIVSALLLGALALPVPDEEVSVVKPVVASDAKTTDEKLVEAKSEARASEKLAALTEEKKPAEKAALATKSSDLPEKKEEKLSESIIPAAADTETSKSLNTPLSAETPLDELAEEKKEEPKALPLSPAPEKIAELKTAEPEKLNAEAPKPVQIVEAKSASSITAEPEKRTEAKLADEAPASEIVSIASAGQAANAGVVDSAISDKKDDTAGRQIRGTDDKVEAAKSVVAGDVKSLSIESPETPASGSESASAVSSTSEEKLKEEKISAEVKSAAVPELEKTIAEKKPTETEKKSDSLPALEIAPEPKSAAAELPEAKKSEELAAPALAASGTTQLEDAKKPELPKKLENPKKQEIVKKDALESKESDESKESAESKEEKSA